MEKKSENELIPSGLAGIQNPRKIKNGGKKSRFLAQIVSKTL